MVVFPGHEDFGIVPVEAQACGTGVVALNAGGTKDTVIHGRTGILVATQEVAAFAEAMSTVLSTPPDARACRHNAERFSRSRFTQELLSWIK